MKIPKKRNKIKGCSITCSHIWHVNIPKCVFQLDTKLVKVWWKHMPPNTNTVHFCNIVLDIEQCCQPKKQKQRWKKCSCIVNTLQKPFSHFRSPLPPLFLLSQIVTLKFYVFFWRKKNLFLIKILVWCNPKPVYVSSEKWFFQLLL